MTDELAGAAGATPLHVVGAVGHDAAETGIRRRTDAEPRADAKPLGLTIPMPWGDYYAQSVYADYDKKIEAIQGAVADTIITNIRYAELMWILDSWHAEDRLHVRADSLTD